MFEVKQSKANHSKVVAVTVESPFTRAGQHSVVADNGSRCLQTGLAGRKWTGSNSIVSRRNKGQNTFPSSKRDNRPRFAADAAPGQSAHSLCAQSVKFENPFGSHRLGNMVRCLLKREV